MRPWDAVVLGGLVWKPDKPGGAIPRPLRILTLSLLGVRGAMKRLEARRYIEPGWRLDDAQVTDAGKRAATAAVAIIATTDIGYLRIRFGRRLYPRRNNHTSRDVSRR